MRLLLLVFIWCIFSTYLIGIMQTTAKFFKNILDGILIRKADNFRLWKVLFDESDINSALFVFLISWWYMISLKKTCVKSLLLWVSSTTFGIPFHLPVQFYNSGSSLSVICKWLLQKDPNIILKSFQKKNIYVFVVTLTSPIAMEVGINTEGVQKLQNQ